MSSFDEDFEHLTGHAPFPWQQALFERFLGDSDDHIPSACDLPTGLGKTSVVAVWLLALAKCPERIPRRLIYVVNRRTVVDQTTAEVERYRKKLTTDELKDLRNSLADLCAGVSPDGSANGSDAEPPLAISTLRGQFADNRAWSADPARPAVVVGTVDMIGSRLLFSGYGCGFKTRPLHAGFLGQDALLVHDEAHLEPAFQELLERIEAEQHGRERTGELPWKKLRVMQLSATTRSHGEGVVFPNDDERRANEADPVVQRRIGAKKSIEFHEVRDEKKELAETIVECSRGFEGSGRAVLIFVRTVDDVGKITKKLPKDSFEQLTGTLRGKERDELVCRPIFQRLLPPSGRADGVVPREGTVYLVCTSAGEVGVNLSADDLVCDLSTFESMAQRFGRVNRFGDPPNDATIHVVHPADFDASNDLDASRERTLALLRRLEGDGSPRALSNLPATDRRAAFAPQPTILPATDILFDAWALTSVRGRLPGRPPVEPYLHGISGWEPPETHVAWREEVGRIAQELLERYPPADLLEDYPLKPHELLRDRSKRVHDHLKSIAARHPDAPAWLVDDDGGIEVVPLKDLENKNGEDRIARRTVLLPPFVGGLEGGMLDGNSTVPADDVADEWLDEDRRKRRIRVWDEDEDSVPTGMRLIRTIDMRPEAEDGEDDEEGDGPARRRFWRWFSLARSADDDLSKSSLEPIRWDHHTGDVTRNVERIVAKLLPPGELQSALVLAAEWHDLGKKRESWQRSIGNPNPTDWHAKSGRSWKPIETTDYRHEFGSLLDVLDERQPHRKQFDALPEDVRELVLHLIAAHHGAARPHFEADLVFDPGRPAATAAAAAAEVPRRFAWLQRRYGRWGLAWLESLLRAADYAASANPSPLPAPTVEDRR